MNEAVFISAPDLWRRGHGPAHPLKPERLERTHALLTAYGAFTPPNSRLVAPRPATDEELCLFHTPEYVDAVRRLSQGDSSLPGGKYNFGPGDNPVWKGMCEIGRLKAGSALVAAEVVHAGEADVAFSYSGGLHHADPARASGFCTFNDGAVAIHWLLEQDLRVAYVDIDGHHGDGVQKAFYDTDQVLTISLHESGRHLFPGTGFVHEIGAGAGEGYSANVPLPPHTDDESYLWAFHEVVPPLIERFQPNVVVSQLGIDTHYRDPLTHLALTTHGYVALIEAIRDLAPRWVALGGGGYDINVVPRGWALAYGVMSEQTFDDELPAAFREKYGGEWLHDPPGAGAVIGDPASIRQQVEESVASLKLLLESDGEEGKGDERTGRRRRRRR
ncbi:MAG: Acetoin utilization protein AcuC [Anaerolineales bacterium]|nr:Acetoin utilization protein AcuC [Anaerolineales bacterium]